MGRTKARIFVTGASGFIGSALVDCAFAAGHTVDAVTRSSESAQRLRTKGVNAVVGDISVPDEPWCASVRHADAIVHLAQPQTFGGRVTRRRARAYTESRLNMDRALFDAVNPAVTRRILYVAGTSYYGDTGSALATEDVVPQPRGWGPYLAPGIEALASHVARGLPIVGAFPGWVYGPGSWFAEYVLEPLADGRPVYGLSGRPRYTSPIHVHDCARAMLHLIEAGAIGQRYFLVDDLPVHGERLAQLAAQAFGVKGRPRKLPLALLQLLVGPVVAESLAYENRLSNNKLLSTGFLFKFPTCEEGVPDVVATWQQRKTPQAFIG